MRKKSKKRPRKKAAQQPITITLTDAQIKQADKEIADNDVAIFEIKDVKGTCAVCTTMTVHR
jgi:hypothetical protein